MDMYYEIDIQSAEMSDDIKVDGGQSHSVNRRFVYFFYVFQCERHSNPEVVVRERLRVEFGQDSSNPYDTKEDCERAALLLVKRIEDSVELADEMDCEC